MRPPPTVDPPPAPRPARPLRELRRSGAWKVAYADFVTTLMALFIVLWMMNASARVKQSVSGYFSDPRGYTVKVGAGPAGAGEGLRFNGSNPADLQRQIQQALERMPDFGKLRDQVHFSVTGEGLRIDLLETEQGLFFVTGSAQPTAAGERLLSVLAAELGKMTNRIVVEGHSDSLAFRNALPASGYGNWELSADRANAARRLLHAGGVRPDQVVEVRGFADQHLLFPEAPKDPRNRRISVVVRLAVE
jgi:chemotaxis protein MotB